MSYSKPEITSVTFAIAGVRGSTIKQTHNVPDSDPRLNYTTVSAYEADE